MLDGVAWEDERFCVDENGNLNGWKFFVDYLPILFVDSGFFSDDNLVVCGL
jgi:hypothetical protein